MTNNEERRRNPHPSGAQKIVPLSILSVPPASPDEMETMPAKQWIHETVSTVAYTQDTLIRCPHYTPMTYAWPGVWDSMWPDRLLCTACALGAMKAAIARNELRCARCDAAMAPAVAKLVQIPVGVGDRVMMTLVISLCAAHHWEK